MEERRLYEISRGDTGPPVVKLTLAEGAFELWKVPDAERKRAASITLGLDDFTRESLLARGFHVEPVERKPPTASAIPRRKAAEVEVKNDVV